MKLKPQNAQNNQQKRRRRQAPEYTFIWSDEAWAIVKDLSEAGITKVRKAAYRRIHAAEAALCGALPYVTITSMEPLAAGDKWWAPFPVGQQWFQLEYRDKRIREYVLTPATGPAPDGGAPPVMTRQQTRRSAAKKEPMKRRDDTRKGGGSQSARPARTRKPPKRIDVQHEFIMLYEVVRKRLDFTFKHLKRALQPRLQRNFDRMKEAGGSAISYVCDRTSSAAKTLRRFASLLHVNNVSFTRARELPAQQIGPSARLEPRWAGQNSGLRIRFYSWIWDDTPPVDWSANLFGVFEIDWSANLFGVLPEQEQAFV